MKKLLLCFLLIFCGLLSHAQHSEILGSHISYKAIDSLNYEVKLTVIHDCSGNVGAINDTLILKAGSYILKQKATFLSSKDITPIGEKCSNKSMCAGGTSAYGFQERIYYTVFSLTNITDCNVYFEWTGNNRSSKITIGAANQNHYNYAYLNYCVTKLNSSSVYTSEPKILLKEGANVFMGIRAIDTIEINDSIGFKMVSAKNKMDESIKYDSPYSYSQFLNYLGAFRDPLQLRFPAGITFDSITGNIGFRPMKAGDISNYCFETNEFRIINGVVQKIGTVRWDMTFMVVKDVNKIPENTLKYTFSDFKKIDQRLCTDVDNEFIYHSSDLDLLDSAKIKIDFSGYHNITFIDSFITKDQSVFIKWNPKNKYIKENNSPYIITIKTYDDACGFFGSNTLNIPFYLNKNTVPSFKVEETLFCKGEDAKLGLRFLDSKKIKSVIWNDTLISNSLIIKENEIPLKIKIKVTDTLGCSLIKEQLIDTFPTFKISVNNIDTTCNGDNPIHLIASPKGGIWHGNAIMQDSIFIPSLASTGINNLTYIYPFEHTCADSLSENIFVKITPKPIINLSITNGKSPLTINFSETSSTQYDSYFWEIKSKIDSFNFNNRNDQLILHSEGIYSVKLTVGLNGCYNRTLIKDTIIVLPYNAGIASQTSQNFSVFPNPAFNELFIKNPKEFSDINYKILDINGKVILEGNITNTQNYIETENLNSGIYFIEISNQENILSKIKFVKY